MGLFGTESTLGASYRYRNRQESVDLIGLR